MAFNPSSTICLCNVPIDSTYKNQLYFADATTQSAYFTTKTVKRFTDYLTVRETLPDGTLQSAVKVGANIDDLRDCNYMFYQNANHGNKYFYAFITKLVYINEKTTKIIFETDVYQTWLFDVTLLQSYVVREHSETDNVGDNTVPEKFDINTYARYHRGGLGYIQSWGYLIGSANPRNTDSGAGKGRLMSGVYQGLYFYYMTSVNEVNTLLDELETAHGDCVQFICLIPKFCVANATISESGLVSATSIPNIATYTVGNILNDSKSVLFNGYTPRNNKLYTYPFTKMVVTNDSGEEADYRIEWFSDPSNIKFKTAGDISTSPTVTVIPLDYNDDSAVGETYTDGISITAFPQCSYNTDTYKLWLAKNQFGTTLDTAGNLASIGFGIGSTLMGNPLGLTQAMSGVNGILNTINQNYQMKKTPNGLHMGSSAVNLRTAMKHNDFMLYMYSIRKEQAQTIDDFFTMYGYQTNRVKVPNVSSRPRFNYVQTVDVNILGGIPADDMERLKAMYNNGVTLWKDWYNVGDYSISNAP